MRRNLKEYFEDGYTFYLKSVKYELIGKKDSENGLTLNCKDKVIAERKDDELIIVFKRKLYFVPRGLYEVIVEYGARLKLLKDLPELDNNIDWNEKFLKEGDFVLNNLVSRSSLLISCITSSYGQPPIVTPSKINAEKG